MRKLKWAVAAVLLFGMIAGLVSCANGGSGTVKGWPSGQISGEIGTDIPDFLSKSGRVEHTEGMGSNTIAVQLTGVTKEEIREYERLLADAGFSAVSGEEDTFVKTVGNTDYYVMITSAEGSWFLAFARKTNQGGHGTIGWESTDDGKETSGGEDPHGGEGPGSNLVSVRIVFLDPQKNIQSETIREYELDSLIMDYINQELYYDQACTRRAPDVIAVTADLSVLYVAGSQSEVRFTIMDIYEDGTADVWQSIPLRFGSEVRYGDYEFVLFEDLECTKPLDPNGKTALTSDLTVYRRDSMQPKYLYLPARFFLNGYDITQVSSIAPFDYLQVRKGKLYSSDDRFGVYPFMDGKYYLDANRSQPLFHDGNAVWFDENSQETIYATLESDEWRTVTYVSNGTTLAEFPRYTGSVDHDLEDYGIYVTEWGQESADGSTVTVVSYERMYEVTWKQVVDGKVIGGTKTHHPKGVDFEMEEREGNFSDPACTVPYSHTGPLSGNITIYQKMGG